MEKLKTPIKRHIGFERACGHAGTDAPSKEMRTHVDEIDL